MKETKHCSVTKYFRIILLFAFILFSFSIQSSLSPSAVASAAKSKTLHVSFNDNSGKYLELRNSDWYLYASNKKSLSDVQYLSIPKTQNLSSGFYMFDKQGKLIQKKAVYQFKQKTVNGAVFDGFHCTNKNGRFSINGGTLNHLSGLKCSDKTFTG